jgi:mRNA interferase MazF
MKRGDLVTIAFQGDYGKLRPALIIQSDLFDEHPTVTIVPVTSELRDAPLFRIRLEPSAKKQAAEDIRNHGGQGPVGTA